MTPKTFCEQKGFSLSFEEAVNGCTIIHIHDRDRKLYKSGKRLGKRTIHPACLTDTILTLYNSIQNQVLEKVFE